MDLSAKTAASDEKDVPMVTCGKCHQTHADVAQVRACYGVAETAHPTMQAKPGKPITEKQEQFITSLMSKLNTTASEAGIDLLQLDRASASALIDKLMDRVKSQPKHTAPPAVTGGTEPKPGTYTLVKPNGEYRTVQIAHAKWADNKLVASYLSGPDNTVAYTGCAFVGGGVVRMWKKFKDDGELAQDVRDLIALNDPTTAHEKFLELAEMYAMESGHCMRCGKKLTVPASLHRGLGPVCAQIEGV